MTRTLLLPNRYKKIGWLLFIPSLIVGIYISITHYEFSFLNTNVFNLIPSHFLEQNTSNNSKWFIEINLTNTLLGVLFILSSLMVGFSKEKTEDEYIAKLRLNALLWSVLVNYILLIIAFLLIYDLSFLSIMVYNMFTVLLLFIFRFHYLLYRSQTALTDEQ